MTKQALCIALLATATSLTGCATYESETKKLFKKSKVYQRFKLDKEIEEYDRQCEEYNRQLYKYENTRWTFLEMPLPIRLVFLVGTAETLSRKRKELEKKEDELDKQYEQIDKKWKALYD